MLRDTFDYDISISIHALREEGDLRGEMGNLTPGTISIHALREEGDPATNRRPVPTAISIHALREEGDRAAAPCRFPSPYFYPRPPRGGRRLRVCRRCRD